MTARSLSSADVHRFSCNGGEKHTAAEMVQIGTYNALIGEHAFYSSSNTSEGPFSLSVV